MSSKPRSEPILAIRLSPSNPQAVSPKIQIRTLHNIAGEVDSGGLSSDKPTWDTMS
jgi:hypothetical protein